MSELRRVHRSEADIRVVLMENLRREDHGPMPIDADGDGPADQADTVAVICWCGTSGCERFRS